MEARGWMREVNILGLFLPRKEAPNKLNLELNPNFEFRHTTSLSVEFPVLSRVCILSALLPSCYDVLCACWSCHLNHGAFSCKAEKLDFGRCTIYSQEPFMRPFLPETLSKDFQDGKTTAHIEVQFEETARWVLNMAETVHEATGVFGGPGGGLWGCFRHHGPWGEWAF